MLELTSGQVIAIATVGLLIVGAVRLIMTLRRRQDGVVNSNPTLTVYPGTEFPDIRATSGVPTMEQLTQGIEVDPKDRRRARLLYEMGLAQFNHYVNNRDGVVAESRRAMESLIEQMDEAEVSLARSTGIALAVADKDELPETLIQYNSLRPQVQIYAQHKRREHEALQTIASDLHHSVPRTDYTSVKSLIELGDVPLDAIMSELPLPWQELRTVSQVEAGDRIVGKPPKREFIHTIFLTRDGRLLEDKRAERDGKWLRSDKHDMLVPFQEPVPVFEARGEGEQPIRTGECRIVIDRDPSPEWITEFWRQGGYRDQQYILARDGKLPEQIRAAYRRRQLRLALWVIVAALATVDVVLLATRYL